MYIKTANKLILKKPWLYLPSSFLHFVHPLALSFYTKIRSSQPHQWQSFNWRGLSFPNPLGTAGGLDKNASFIKNYWSLGAGFLEIGTVTPEPQSSNTGQILNRSLKHLSLWNNMGFPNKGLSYFQSQLEELFKSQSDFPTPLFINLGKNRKTPLESAVLDYQKGLLALNKYASAFVINISSPNTKSLREIFDTKRLSHFLKSLVQIRSGFNKNIPLILKLSPDEEDWLRVVEESLLAGIDGWCLTNSTRRRPVPNLFPADRGGISGQLLAPFSIDLLKQLKAWLRKNKIEDKLVISCGGVLSPQDVFQRLDLGANLVQVYSALVFQGYSFFHSVSKAHSLKNTIQK